MKRIKITGWVIVAIILLLAVLNFTIATASPAAFANSVNLRNSFVGLFHGDLGFWLKGDLVTARISDWSFADTIENVQIETRTWYLLPHFVRTDIVRNGSQLYLFSEYFAPSPGQPDHRDEFPNARFWNRMVIRDPHIRVKIGDRIFQMRAYPLTDPNQVAVVRQAFLNKYADARQLADLPESQRPKLYFFRLVPGWSDNQ
jgi:hypothetical protein